MLNRSTLVSITRLLLYLFNGTATTEIYTYGPPLSLHDALPIYRPAIGQAEHLTNRLRADPAAFHPGVRDRLIEDRQPVARRTFGGAGDQRQRFGLGLDAFLLGHPGEMRAELVGGNAAQVETLAARQHRHRDRKSTRLNSSH